MRETAEVLAEDVERRDDVRQAISIELEPALVDLVEKHIDTQRAAVSAFFGTTITSREGTGFLRYLPGGFYAPHRDRAVIRSWSGAARRQFAIVVFLNSSREAAPPGEFWGGTLRLFLDDEGTLDLHPRQGLLVVFSAETLHEVTIVGGGNRDVLVDWFY